MNKKSKILGSAFFVGLLLFCWIGQVILTRDPISQGFPLSQAWKTRLQANIVGISVVSDQRVLVRTSSSLNALDTKNGKVIWQHTLSWQADPKPAIAENGKVYVTDGDSLMALDQQNGSVLWQYPTSYTESWVTDVSESLVIINQVGVNIMVFDAKTGAFLWRKPVCRGFVQAYTDDKKIFVPCNGLEALDAKSAETAWIADVGILGNVGYSVDKIYYLSNTIQAYDLQDQKNLWSTTVANDGFENFTIVKDALFYTDAERLCLLDINNGHLKWCANTSYPESPSIIESNVYIFDGSHKTVTALHLSDGKKLGMLKLPNFNYFITNRQLLTSTENLLFFPNGKIIYAYAK